MPDGTSCRAARPRLGACAVLLPALLAAAPQPHTFALREGTLTYTVVHKLHEVQGTTRTLEGRAQVLADGTLHVQVRARLATFDSGNSSRDEHMREATHEPEHPIVDVKGTAHGVRLPLTAPLEVPLDAVVQLNGRKGEQTIRVRLVPEGRAVRAKFSFPVSLDAFGVERPELLLVKVDDRVKVTGDLLFAEEAP